VTTPLLPDLLRALLDGTEVPWYRLFYMYPSGITPELVTLLAGEPRILPYLDMPIQHGSDAVLRRMRRPERQATIRERVGWLRDAIPGMTLRTTVIVGFPGETDAEFEEMLSLLEEIRFERVGAFTYSPEEGNPAAEMPDPVEEDVQADRLERSWSFSGRSPSRRTGRWWEAGVRACGPPGGGRSGARGRGTDPGAGGGRGWVDPDPLGPPTWSRGASWRWRSWMRWTTTWWPGGGVEGEGGVPGVTGRWGDRSMEREMGGGDGLTAVAGRTGSGGVAPEPRMG
jgi:hypothetical protein